MSVYVHRAANHAPTEEAEDLLDVLKSLTTCLKQMFMGLAGYRGPADLSADAKYGPYAGKPLCSGKLGETEVLLTPTGVRQGVITHLIPRPPPRHLQHVHALGGRAEGIDLEFLRAKGAEESRSRDRIEVLLALLSRELTGEIARQLRLMQAEAATREAQTRARALSCAALRSGGAGQHLRAGSYEETARDVDLPRLRAEAAQERAEAADAVMRLLEEHHLVGAEQVMAYLRGTIDTTLPKLARIADRARDAEHAGGSGGGRGRRSLKAAASPLFPVAPASAAASPPRVGVMTNAGGTMPGSAAAAAAASASRRHNADLLSYATEAAPRSGGGSGGGRSGVRGGVGGGGGGYASLESLPAYSEPAAAVGSSSPLARQQQQPLPGHSRAEDGGGVCASPLAESRAAAASSAGSGLKEGEALSPRRPGSDPVDRAAKLLHRDARAAAAASVARIAADHRLGISGRTETAAGAGGGRGGVSWAGGPPLGSGGHEEQEGGSGVAALPPSLAWGTGGAVSLPPLDPRSPGHAPSAAQRARGPRGAVSSSSSSTTPSRLPAAASARAAGGRR